MAALSRRMFSVPSGPSLSSAGAGAPTVSILQPPVTPRTESKDSKSLATATVDRDGDLLMDPESVLTEDNVSPLPGFTFRDLIKVVTMGRETFRLMSGNKPFYQTIHAQSSLSSDGAGVLRGFIPFDPVLLSSADYVSFASLFDEVKLVTAEVGFIPVANASHASTNSGSAVTLVIRSIMAGVDRNAISTSTSSYIEVLRLDGAQELKRTTADTGGVGIISYSPPRNRPYASTAVPATIDPPAGCVGMVRYAAATAVTVSQVYYDIVVKLKIVLRNRV